MTRAIIWRRICMANRADRGGSSFKEQLFVTTHARLMTRVIGNVGKRVLFIANLIPVGRGKGSVAFITLHPVRLRAMRKIGNLWRGFLSSRRCRFNGPPLGLGRFDAF